MEPTAASATYTVLARRYRPQGFEEVIGQEHIAQSLRNAILSGRVAHAYLFTGARGVGKTSTARILAKALNCPNAVDGAPCNQCDACEGIAAGRDVDVLEIDGASNRGIDDIRQLRANVSVKSMRSKYKIYIIDEVHMLTKEAFNALLKTLEEPPPNVKFVFCTTEPNKVPDTILSRCQRFDFGTIGLTQIIDRLASIATAEKMEVEPAALELVARRAAGSMRDSQSIFDQLLASADKKITAAEVHRLLGTASDERLMELFASIIARQRGQALALFSHALSEGAQLGELADQILNYLRDLMVLAAEADNVPLLSVSETNRAALTKQAQAWGLNTIVAALQIVAEAKLKMQRATFARALVELALIRLTLLEQLQSLDALLTELTSPQTARALSVSAGDSEKKKPESIDYESRTGTLARPADAIGEPASIGISHESVRSSSPYGSEDSRVLGDQPIHDASDDRDSDVLSGTLSESARPTESPGGSALEPVQEQHRDLSEISRNALASGSCVSIEPDARLAVEPTGKSAHPTETAPATPVPPQSSADFRPGMESVFWSQVLSDIGDDFGIHFRKVARVAICGPNRLELVFPKSYLFSKSFCEKIEVRGRLEEVAGRLAGKPVQVTFAVTDDGPPAEPATPRTATPNRRMDLSTNGDPYVDKAIELFNAKIMKKEAVTRVNATTD